MTYYQAFNYVLAGKMPYLEFIKYLDPETQEDFRIFCLESDEDQTEEQARIFFDIIFDD